jgi:hypothetical protein
MSIYGLFCDACQKRSPASEWDLALEWVCPIERVFAGACSEPVRRCAACRSDAEGGRAERWGNAQRAER